MYQLFVNPSNRDIDCPLVAGMLLRPGMVFTLTEAQYKVAQVAIAYAVSQGEAICVKVEEPAPAAPARDLEAVLEDAPQQIAESGDPAPQQEGYEVLKAQEEASRIEAEDSAAAQPVEPVRASRKKSRS